MEEHLLERTDEHYEHLKAVALRYYELQPGNHIYWFTECEVEDAEMLSLWVVHIDGRRGVPIVEYERDGVRVYEVYPYEETSAGQS